MSDINPNLWEQAEILATRDYDVELFEDTLSNGASIFLAKTPELRGCMAQGSTLEEARNELILARTNFIYFQLLDGLPVPSPRAGTTKTSANVEADTFTVTNNSGGSFTMHSFDEFSNTENESDNKEKLGKISFTDKDERVTM